MKGFSIVLSTVLVAVVSSQSFSDLPACAQNCTINAIPASCNLDPLCICKSPSWGSIPCCAAGVCDAADLQATIQYMNSICNPAGVTLASTAVCASTSTAAATSSTSSTFTTTASSKISSAPPPASSTAVDASTSTAAATRSTSSTFTTAASSKISSAPPPASSTAVDASTSTAAATSSTSSTFTTAASGKISSASPSASSTPSGGITAGVKAGIGVGIAGGGLILAIIIGLVLFRRRRRARVQRTASQRRFEKPEIDSKPLDRPKIPDIAELDALGSLREKFGITGGEPTIAELYGGMVSVSSTAASPTVPSGVEQELL